MSYRRVFFQQEIYFHVYTLACTIRVYTIVYSFSIKSRTHNIYVLYNIYGITPILSKVLNLDSIPRYGRVYIAVPGSRRVRLSAADTVVCTVGLLLNGGSFSKASAPPLFLEDENIFQKSASWL